MSNARRWPCTIEEYHADTTAISNSGLGEILKNPKRYHALRIAKTLKPKEATYFEFGQLLHSAVLVPGPIGSGIKIIPRNVLSKSGSRAGAGWKSFERDNPGKVLCKESDPLVAMIESLKECEAAVDLLEACIEFESTIVWHDDEFDVDVRVRLDGLTLGADTIIDIKSTTDADSEPFARSIANFAYDRQASLYIDGAEELLGVRPGFVFIAMEKEPPYRVETYDLSKKFLRCGDLEKRRALATYAKCKHSGMWVPPSKGRIITLEPPGYRLHSNEWSLNHAS